MFHMHFSDPRYSTSVITRWLVIYGGGLGVSAWFIYSGTHGILHETFTIHGRRRMTMNLTGTDAVLCGVSMILLAVILHLWAFWECHTKHQVWAEPLRNLFALIWAANVLVVFYRVFIDLFTKGF